MKALIEELSPEVSAELSRPVGRRHQHLPGAVAGLPAIHCFDPWWIGLQPTSPVRRTGIADVGDGRSAGARRRRHSPAHHNHLALGAGIAHDRRRIIWKDARHRRCRETHFAFKYELSRDFRARFFLRRTCA